ncbi:hypothetical protein LZ32DRAFT_608182 [Colletotrichum eremochloae]|nr:hypothetical protein LZ32DRAFT_608182 [Colletotrichum eremochloae]
MFDAERQRLLGSCIWSPGEGHLGYFEAWTDDSAAGSVAGNCRTGFLDDDEVEQWLHQQGRFSPLVKPGQAKPTMRIRLLMCERLGWLPVGFAMSRSSFLAVETTFRLPTETLPNLVTNNGKQYSNLRFRTDHDNRLESVVLTAKLPQMFQLGNLGLAMSHDLETGTTVAFLHGWNMFSDRDAVTNEPIVPHAESLHGMMQSATTLWAHPLFLPTVLLREHLSKAEFFQSHLEPQVMGIERDLGVARSGRLVNSKSDAYAQRMIQDDRERFRMTARLNTTATDVVNMLGVLEWDLHYFKFLGRVNGELAALHGRISPAADAELRSLVDYLECEALSIVSFVGTMKSRLDLQLNVLYNYIAQAESNLSRQIATNAGLDSTAMKTLAVVTMVFLPPTFIATLFSMSMFDWQSSSSAAAGDTGRTVVPEFWIYWAVSVPLTLAIVVGWRVWWHFQKGYYENKYLSVKPSEVPGSRRRMGNGA